MQTTQAEGFGTGSCQMLALRPPSVLAEKDSAGFLLRSAANHPATRPTAGVETHRHIQETCLSHRRHYWLEAEEPRNTHTQTADTKDQATKIQLQTDTSAAPKIQSNEDSPHHI